MTLRIRNDMALTDLDLLSAVEATWSTGFSCFDAPTVNDGGRRIFIVTAKLGRDANERFVEKIEDAAITEPIVMILDARIGWKALRE